MMSGHLQGLAKGRDGFFRFSALPEAEAHLGEALQCVCGILRGFLKCSAACLNRPTFLSAVPRSYDSYPSGVPVDAVASSACRNAAGMGALSSFSDEARCEAGWFSCVRDNALVSFTFLFPVGYESKWPLSSQVLDHSGWFSNPLRFNIFAPVFAGVSEVKQHVVR